MEGGTAGMAKPSNRKQHAKRQVWQPQVVKQRHKGQFFPLHVLIILSSVHHVILGHLWAHGTDGYLWNIICRNGSPVISKLVYTILKSPQKNTKQHWNKQNVSYVSIKKKKLIRPTSPRYTYIYTGWWYTYPSEKYESQLGWWHSQLNGTIKKCSKPPTRTSSYYIIFPLLVYSLLSTINHHY